MSRLILQVCTAVLALVPIATGVVSKGGVRAVARGAGRHRALTEGVQPPEP